MGPKLRVGKEMVHYTADGVSVLYATEPHNASEFSQYWHEDANGGKMVSAREAARLLNIGLPAPHRLWGAKAYQDASLQIGTEVVRPDGNGNYVNESGSQVDPGS